MDVLGILWIPLRQRLSGLLMGPPGKVNVFILSLKRFLFPRVILENIALNTIVRLSLKNSNARYNAGEKLPEMINIIF